RKGASVPAPAAAAAPAAPAAEATPPAPAAAPATPAQPASAPASPSKPLAKPPVRKLAKDLGVELSQVTPTGPRGEVTRDDVHAAANQTTAPTAGATAPAAASASDQGALEERIPFKGVTK